MTTDESGATDPTTTEPTTTTPTTTTPSTAAPVTTTQNPGGDLPEYTIPDDGSLDVNDVMEGYILSPRFDPDDPTGNRYPNNVNGQINLAVSDSVSRIVSFFSCLVTHCFSLFMYRILFYCCCPVSKCLDSFDGVCWLIQIIMKTAYYLNPG